MVAVCAIRHGSHWPRVGHVWLLCIREGGQSELRCAARVKHTLGFRHFICKCNVNYLLITCCLCVEMAIFWTYWVKSNILLKCMPLVSCSLFQCGSQKTDHSKWGSHSTSVGQCSLSTAGKLPSLRRREVGPNTPLGKCSQCMTKLLKNRYHWKSRMIPSLEKNPSEHCVCRQNS